MQRFWNRPFVFILITALLAAQVLLASHACDRLGVGQVQTISSAAIFLAGPQVAEENADCCSRSALCLKHCGNEPGTTDSPGPASDPPLATAFAVPLVVPGFRPPPSRPFDPALSHTTAPPAAILHCCWRI